MELHLLRLSSDQMSAIIEKMNRSSLCTLRRASKTIDSVAEENRLALSRYSKSDPLSLKMTVSGKVGQNGISCSVYNSDNTRVICRRREVGKVVRDPYSQLSGQWFNVLVVDLLPGPTESAECFAAQLPICFEKLLPLLTKMKITCAHFVYISQYTPICLELIVPLITLSSIEIRSPLDFETLNQWPIQNCRKADLTKVAMTNHKLSTVLRHFEIPEVTITPERNILNDFKAYVKQFLEDVRKDSSAKGKIRTLRIANTEGNMIIPDGVDFGFRFNSPNIGINAQMFDMFLFKIPLNDGGMAVILIYHVSIEITFVSIDDRESLFHSIAPYLFSCTPYDVSSVFDNFLAEEDPRQAVDSLFKGFQADYLFKP